MKFSDALPIQFWLAGQQVFNEKTNTFVDFKKFFHKVECDQSIVLQFTDTEQRTYRIRFLDDQDAEITTQAFVIASYPTFYRYTVSFDFQSLGICDQKVKMEIYYDENSLAFDVDDLIETISFELVVANSATFDIDDLIETMAVNVVVSNTSEFKIDTVLGTVCAQGDTTLYWTGAFDTGTVIYTDLTLTTPLTGYDYIAAINIATGDPAQLGRIWNINDSTGEIETDTTSTC